MMVPRTAGAGTATANWGLESAGITQRRPRGSSRRPSPAVGRNEAFVFSVNAQPSLRGERDAVAKAPGFRELTHFTIVTYGPFALREGVTAPRRSTPTGGGSDRTLLLECRLEQLRGALDEARAEADQARIRLPEAAAREARETLLTRVVEWHGAVRHGDTEAVDLAEFIASLRRAVLDLERDNALGERREAALREQLEQATAPAMQAVTPEPPEPPQPPADDLVAALAAAQHPQDQVELLLRLGRPGGGGGAAVFAPPPPAPPEKPHRRAPGRPTA